MQQQTITKVNNGFIVNHGEHTFVYSGSEDLGAPYITDFIRQVNQMKTGEKLYISLDWALNPTIEQDGFSPLPHDLFAEKIIDFTAKVMGSGGRFEFNGSEKKLIRDFCAGKIDNL